MTVNLAAYNGVLTLLWFTTALVAMPQIYQCLNACIRQAFVNLYVDYDPLADFKSQTEQAANINLPPLPDKGDLDVKVVVNSEFFFA